MRQRALIVPLLSVGVGIGVGATVFRTDIAQATGLAQSVTVNNTAANPVPVTSADDPGRQAFAFAANDPFETVIGAHVSLTVPAGKRLVIESVSIDAELVGDATQKLVRATVQAEVNDRLEEYRIAPTFTGTSFFGKDLYTPARR